MAINYNGLEEIKTDDLISRQAAIDALDELVDEKREEYAENPHIDLIYEWIENLPAVTLTRPKGKWIEETGKVPKCSECGIYSDDADKGYDSFCPNCGADMRGEAE